MARAKKDGHYINANIQKELYDAIVKHCEETGLNKTKWLIILSVAILITILSICINFM